jgi:hypothetical protein
MYDARVARAIRHPRIAAQLQHEAGAHPTLADHASMGLLTAQALQEHAATPHGGDAGPHDHDGYATTGALDQVADAADSALAAAQAADALAIAAQGAVDDHAGTPHGLSSHALDGAYHTGTEVLPTAGQKNALAGTAGTPGSGNPYVTDQDARLADVRTPAAHDHEATDLPLDTVYTAALDAAIAAHGSTDPHLGTHNHDANYEPTGAVAAHTSGAAHTGLATDAELAAAVSAHEAAVNPHAGYATDADLAAHAADTELHGGAPGTASEAFPVGSVFLSVVSTDPGTLLGYGTWQAIAAGRMLVGLDGGDAAFDAAEETGGAKTHTHAAHSGVISHTHPITDPGHVHDEYQNSATTGPSAGWGARDTSTNSPIITDYDTGSSVTGISVDAPTGAVSELTHDAPSHLPPYFVVHVWKRTA